MSVKYCYRQNFEDITRYLIMKYWPILAFQGHVKAKLLYNFPIVGHIFAGTEVFYAIF